MPWLVKTEPTVFSFFDLMEAKKRTTDWTGVRNYQARNYLRDGMKLKDKVLVYHSNTKDIGIYGLCEVVKEAYPDPTATLPTSPYYDPKAEVKNPWVAVDLMAIALFTPPLVREELKKNKGLSSFELLKKGTRLSVLPVSDAQYSIILSLVQKTNKLT